jgi:hypothetical protein
LPSSFEFIETTDESVPPHDPSFDSRVIALAWSVVENGRARTARLDLDNDGRLDDVLVEPLSVARDHIRAEIWSWRSASGESHRVPVLDRLRERASGLRLEDDPYAGYMFKPIRWRDRTVLYVRLLPLSNATEEAHAARATRSGVKQAITRGLLEVFPDGAARLLCGWAPRPRPEDRL